MERKRKYIVTILMYIYLLMLTWVIVFKANLNTIYFMFSPEFRSISLMPTFNMRETFLNILAFIPLGIYLKMIAFKRKSVIQTLIVLSISLFYEITQYILAVGTSDITDVISNTLGGIVGLMIYSLLVKLLKGNAEKVCTILACVGTVLLALIAFIYDI